jgi:PilZ domain
MHNLGGRKETRVPTQEPALVIMLDTPLSSGAGTLVNISANGLLLRLTEPLKLSAASKIAVRLRSASIRGEVKHTTHVADGMLVGVAIDDVEYYPANADESSALNR